MELREYGRILRQRWWLLVLLPLLAAAFSVLTYEEPPVSYAYDLQYSVSFLPVESDTLEQDPRLSAVQASEYVADDLTEIFRGSRFATLVQGYLPDGTPVGAISGATRADKLHRLVTVSLAAPTAGEVEALAEATQQATQNDLEALLNELWGSGGLRMELVNASGAIAVSGGLRSMLNLPLRVALALIAAVALAFVLDYLDDSIRTRAEAEGLVAPVLGEIPGR